MGGVAEVPVELARFSFIGSHRLVALAALMLAGAILLPGDNSASAAGPGVIERVGLGRGAVAISADGRFVAFTEGNISASIFLHDRKTNSTQAIGLGWFKYATLDISADGRYLAFGTGEALVPEDTCCADIYVYDREQDSYELVSLSSDGSPGNDDSGYWDDIAISGDGRFVAFVSQASNLVPDDTNICYMETSCRDVFVRDRLLGTTKRVSVTTDGSQGDYESGGSGVNMSADGRFVAFESYNLGHSDGWRIAVRDRDTDEDGSYDEPGAVDTSFVSDPYSGFAPVISDDGRFVASHSWDQGDPIVLNDRQNETTTVIAEAGYWAWGTAPDLSSDGRYLAFASGEPLVPEDTNGVTDVYLYDRVTGAMELLSMASDGNPGNSHSAAGYPLESMAVIALTPDGRFAAFHSVATNLMPGEDEMGVFVAATSVLGILDTDGDGCSDKQEHGIQEALGGRRDSESFWDFFDVPIGELPERDRRVNAFDIGAVVLRFGTVSDPPPTKEEALAEALTPPSDLTSYHAAFDRNSPDPEANPWNVRPPNGSIDGFDIGFVAAQFGHTCA